MERDSPTGYGLFLLADSYLDSAKALVDAPLRLITAGPIRLLCIDACELFLKAYVRERRDNRDDLRSLGHNLVASVEVAQDSGLLIEPELVSQLRRTSDKRDYVRVRYRVVEDRSDMTAGLVIQLAEGVRAAVQNGAHFPK